MRLPLLVYLAAGGVVLLLGMLIFALNMRRGLNHDEHQFIAGGALMAQGMLPYRDFAWFHMPGQGWVNALLFRFFDHLLLTARVVSIVAATGTLALLMAVALRNLRNYRPWGRLGVATLILLLLISAPGYWFAAGRAWNHDLAVLLALVAFCILALALQRQRDARANALWLAGLAGLVLGAAISVRLTLAPLALPFLLAPACWQIRGWQWGRIALALAAGMAMGAMPIWLGFASSPGGFLFGNLRYAALNTEWYALQGADTGLWAKMQYIATQLVQPGNLLLLALAAIALWRVRGAILLGNAPALRFWLLVLPFVLVGGVAPTPMQVQYLFALFPFCALGLILALGHAPPVRWFTLLLGISTVIGMLLAAPRYAEGLEVLPTPTAWYPVKIHQRGRFLAEMMQAQASAQENDWAFTLSPILPLEGGVSIDPRTATGPFAWRIADLIDAAQRVEYGLLGPAELESALATLPPRALLTAMHNDDESADDAILEGWAMAHEYVSIPMPDEGTLWLSPLAQWEDIRLGAQTFPTVVTPGESIEGRLYLQSSAPTETNLNLLLRAVDVEGNELFRFDGWPFGSATSTWESEALWQDGHSFTLPAGAAEGNYRIEASFYDPATVETVGDVETIGWITVVDRETLVAPLADFGEMDLLQIEPSEITLVPGEETQIELQWRADTPLAVDYTRFLHLVDSRGTLVAQADAPPQGGFYPTSAWNISVPVRDVAILAVPAELAAGAYVLHVGLYDAATGQRLQNAAGGDSFALPIQVDNAGSLP